MTGAGGSATEDLTKRITLVAIGSHSAGLTLKLGLYGFEELGEASSRCLMLRQHAAVRVVHGA